MGGSETMFSLYIICAALAAYLIGSLPTGYLVGRAKGIDLRKEGSGNIGATNALRVLGKGIGGLVLLVDMAKGVLSCWVAPWVPVLLGAATQEVDADHLLYQLIGGVGAVLGHSFTCWLRFKGGKGVATAAGVFLALAPWAALVCVLLFAIVVALTGYVSLGSIVAAMALPVAVYFFHYPFLLTLFTTLVALLVIYRHRSNLKRLLNGTELKFGKKK